MKAFLKTYAVCLILMEVFIFFGGWMLFDLIEQIELPDLLHKTA